MALTATTAASTTTTTSTTKQWRKNNNTTTKESKPKAIFDRNSKLLGAYSILLLSVQARPVNCKCFHSPRNLFNCTNFQRKKKYILNVWNEWSLLIKPKKIENEWKHKYALKSKLDFYCFVSFGTQLFSDFCQCISSLSSNNNNNNKKNTHTHTHSHTFRCEKIYWRFHKYSHFTIQSQERDFFHF